MVEAPGTAPGSEWFIATAIYRHSRQAGTPNIGANEPRRKSGSGGCANFSPPLVSSCGERLGSREAAHNCHNFPTPPQTSSQPKSRIGRFRPLNKAIKIIFRSEREKRRRGHSSAPNPPPASGTSKNCGLAIEHVRR